MSFLKGLLAFITSIASIFGFMSKRKESKEAEITEATHEATLKDINDGKPTDARNRLLKWMRRKSSKANKD